MFSYIMQIIQPWYHYGTDSQENEVETRFLSEKYPNNFFIV